MGFLGILKELFSTVGRIFGYAQQRDAEKNAPDVKNAEIAQKSVDVQNKIETDVAKEDVNAIRNDIAE